MVTTSGTGASGCTPPSNTASLSAAMPVSDTPGKAPQSGPAKKQTSSRSGRAAPYQFPNFSRPSSTSRRGTAQRRRLSLNSDISEITSADSETDDVNAGVHAHVHIRTSIPADSKTTSSSLEGDQGKTKVPSTSKLIACFEEEVEASTRPLRDEIAKLKKDNAWLNGENRANNVDLRRLRVDKDHLKATVVSLQADLESSKKRQADIKEAAEKIRDWAQSRVEKEYEEATDAKDKVEERLKSLEEVKKYIEAFGK